VTAHPNWRRLAPIVAVLVAYGVLAWLLYWPVVPTSAHSIVSCACGDPIQQVWFLAWTPDAIARGANPFLSNTLNYPIGVNLAANTTMPLLGLVGAPITATLGPVATFNLLLRLGFFCSAGVLYAIARRVRTSHAAAFVAGLIYGFSPVLIGQGYGHLNLTFVAFPPLILALIYDLVGPQRFSPRRCGLWLCVCLICQYAISTELLSDTLVVGVVAVVLAAVRRPRLVRPRLAHAGRTLAWALVPSIAVAAYPTWAFLFGPGHLSGTVAGPERIDDYRADLFGLVVPTSLERLAPAGWKALGVRIGAGAGLIENGSYLGAPLLLVAIGAAIAERRRGLVRAVALVGVIAAVLALGRTLLVDGTETHIPLPYAVLAHLPLVRNALPVRFELFAQLAAALLCAIGLDRAWSWLRVRVPGHSVWAVAGAAVLGAVVLAPRVPDVPYPSAPVVVPAFVSAGASEIGDNDVVLTSPYPLNPNVDAMLWQAMNGMRYRLLGGYILVRGADGHGTNTPSVLPPWHHTAGQPFDVRAAIVDYITRYRVNDIVAAGHGAGEVHIMAVLTKVLGPPRHDGGVSIWTGLQARERSLSGGALPDR
jgi:hypothetical protein